MCSWMVYLAKLVNLAFLTVIPLPKSFSLTVLFVFVICPLIDCKIQQIPSYEIKLRILNILR